MIDIRIKKGYDIRAKGGPAREVVALDRPTQVAVLPDRIPFIKPKLHVAPGDTVAVGSLLFTDKRRPEVRYLSPGGGTIGAIDFGPRRAINRIVIDLDETEASVDHGAAEPKEMSRRDLVERLLNSGVWPLIRQLPFRDYSDPDQVPPSIIVSLNDSEPFLPAPSVYLRDRLTFFDRGIEALEALSGGAVWVVAREGQLKDEDSVAQRITHRIKGSYPAPDPATVLYHLKKTVDENRSWYIDGQDLLSLGQLLVTGHYPTEVVLALAGDMTEHACHVRTRKGVPIAHILDSFDEPHRDGTRVVIGGLFSGHTGDWDSHIGFHEKSLNLIAEGREREFLGFVRPGMEKPSYSRTFLSAVNRGDLKIDCNRHGDERACIACGNCSRICPVDILPQLTFKAILIDEVDDYLAHGLLDCVECGLCSYVCPSKIELADILRDAKRAYYLEQA